MDFLRPPTFDDREKTRLAAVLVPCVWAIVLGCLGFAALVVPFSVSKQSDLVIVGVVLAASAVVLRLARAGRVRAGSVLFVVALAGAAAGGALATPRFHYGAEFLIVVVVAGGLLGGRGGVIAAVVLIGAEVVRRHLGGEPLSVSHPEIFLLGIELLTAAAFMSVTHRSVSNALSEANSYASDLASKAADLALTSSQLRDEIAHHQRTQEALTTARDQALAASQVKSRFLANMSHEIRTPMNAITGMSDLLLDMDLEPQQSEFVEIIRQSTESLLVILNDILDISRIESGNLELERMPVDIRDCAAAAFHLVASTATEKNLDLALRVAADVPAAIEGDRTRLRQILVNLLGNAVKFTSEGAVELRVEADRLADASAASPAPGDVTADGAGAPGPCDGAAPHTHVLHIRVEDTGIGIPPEFHDRLFDSFSQADATTTRQYGGSGLGLAIVRELVEAMGGDIHVDSERGRGSTFHFAIPTRASPCSPPEYLRPEQPLLAGKRLLVADARPRGRCAMVELARGWHMSVITAASAEEVSACMQAGSLFDAAVVDERMTTADGRQVARLIASGAGPPPVVAIAPATASFRPGEPVGADTRVTAPVTGARLHAALCAVLSSGGGRVDKPRKRPPQLDPTMAGRIPLRILVAEDNDVSRTLAVEILARLGYATDVATTGREAVESAQRRAYDIIFMDVYMPELDGLEATRRIREASAGAEQPYIVGLSASALTSDRDRCLAAGMNEHLGKPFKLAELIAAMKRAAGVGEPPPDPTPEER